MCALYGKFWMVCSGGYPSKNGLCDLIWQVNIFNLINLNFSLCIQCSQNPSQLIQFIIICGKNFNCQKTMYFILYYLDIHLCTHAISTISAVAIKIYTYFILTHITHILCVYYFTIYTECHIVRSTHYYLATSTQYLCEHKGSLRGRGFTIISYTQGCIQLI